MSNEDPTKVLREELLAAAYRQEERRQTDRRARSHIRRRRWPLWAGIGVIVIGGPTIAAATGVIDLRTGTLPDGSTYTSTVSTATSTVPKAEAQVCDNVIVRDKHGTAISGGGGCGPAAARTKDAVTLLGITQSDDRQDVEIVQGSVAPDVQTVTFNSAKSTSAQTPVRLQSRADDERRYFTLVAPLRGGTVTGYDAAAHEIAKATIPATPPPPGHAGG